MHQHKWLKLQVVWMQHSTQLQVVFAIVIFRITRVSCACLDKSLFLSFSKKSLFLLVRLCNYRSGSRLSLTFDNVLCSIYIEQSLVIWLIQLERDFSYKFDNYMDTPESTTCIKWICKSSTYKQVSEACYQQNSNSYYGWSPFSKTS